MGIVVTPESEYGRELAKWNAPRPHPMYPRMLYRAQQKPNGQWACMEADPPPLGYATEREWQAAVQRAEQFTLACQRTVQDEREEQAAQEQGWRNSPAEALACAEQRAQGIAQQAAERAYSDRHLGELARRELDAAEAGTHEHVLDVPRRPGRPRKIEQE